MFYYQPVVFYIRTVLDVIGASVELLTTSGVVFVTGELVMDSVVVVVKAVVRAVPRKVLTITIRHCNPFNYKVDYERT